LSRSGPSRHPASPTSSTGSCRVPHHDRRRSAGSNGPSITTLACPASLAAASASPSFRERAASRLTVSVIRPGICQVAADRASVMRCRRSLTLLASGRCLCCHRYCQTRSGERVGRRDQGVRVVREPHPDQGPARRGVLLGPSMRWLQTGQTRPERRRAASAVCSGSRLICEDDPAGSADARR